MVCFTTLAGPASWQLSCELCCWQQLLMCAPSSENATPLRARIVAATSKRVCSLVVAHSRRSAVWAHLKVLLESSTRARRILGHPHIQVDALDGAACSLK
jgi:hypothetical protein